jgi:hypothetical protein
MATDTSVALYLAEDFAGHGVTFGQTCPARGKNVQVRHIDRADRLEDHVDLAFTAVGSGRPAR